MVRMANIRVVVCVAACLFATFVAAEEPGAIHRASEQRMLAQRIVKSYSQIGLNVLPMVAMQQLGQALAEFDANLTSLAREGEGEGEGDEIKRDLEQLAQLWQGLKLGALSPVSQERVLELSRDADSVENAARQLVQTLQDRSDTPANRRVTLAGRQSMLCQRIAKAFMLLSWGVDAASIRDELDTASNEFSGGLNVLLSQRENSVEIRRELDDVALQWEWLQAAIAAEGVSSYRLIVAEATESILVSTMRITRMYEKASTH